MDQGKEGLNSSKKKRMEKTSDDQKELDDQMEQARKRFKNTVTPAQLQKMRLLLAEETDSEKTETDKETSYEETETDETEEEEEEEKEEEPSVISPAGSSTNNPKGMKMKKRTREEEKKSKSNSLSDTCTSTLRILTKMNVPMIRSPPRDQGSSSCRKNL